VHIESLVVGPIRTNCYLMHDGKHAWIIDPGFDGQRIASIITKHRLQPEAVFLTHSHWDHVMGLPDLLAVFPKLSILIHPSDSHLLGKEGGRKSIRAIQYFDPSLAQKCRDILERLPEATNFLLDGQILEDCGLKVLHTPGHTPGSVSLYQENAGSLFSGDTLFAGTIGRTDLPGSDPDAIIPGILTKLLVLPNQTKVFPGHGRTSTIGNEKRQNPWLQTGV
jgi:hydroxyacylglutathione hydrolase